ncbi:MAG: hypothetical protein DWQ07_13880 [Chloroflexi bacterium]|nr:MAG: hypothetical protein DWQ07_13880 [Chloroflexota bacterium]MBL1197425.1 hypothetical protein [Chloroflexota bacterium]NOH14720.1 hypothetical protein [Chloroflexota bacterium]
MNDSIQSLEAQWNNIPPQDIESRLLELLQAAQDDQEMSAILQAYLARVQTLQMKMTDAGNTLESAGPLQGSRMDKGRILFFIERGRWLVAQGKVKHGVDQWDNALHIAHMAGQTELAEEAQSLKDLYRDMVKVTHAFTYDEMKAYVRETGSPM